MVSWCVVRPTLLATGDGVGRVMIWKLNTELSQQNPKEQDILDELASVTAE